MRYFNWFGMVYKGKIEGTNFIADGGGSYPIKIKERYNSCGLITKEEYDKFPEINKRNG